MCELELKAAPALHQNLEIATLLHGVAVPILTLLPLPPQVEPAGGTWAPSSTQGQWDKALCSITKLFMDVKVTKEK